MRGQAMAEAKVEEVLDAALDAQHLTLAGDAVRAALAQEWNADGSRLRTRLLTAMTRKAESRQEKVAEALDARRDADVARAREIFGAFRTNLRESRERLAARDPHPGGDAVHRRPAGAAPPRSRRDARTGWRAWTRRSSARSRRSPSGTPTSSRTCRRPPSSSR